MLYAKETKHFVIYITDWQLLTSSEKLGKAPCISIVLNIIWPIT